MLHSTGIATAPTFLPSASAALAVERHDATRAGSWDSAPVPTACILNPAFDAHYRTWLAAEVAIAVAMGQGKMHTVGQLEELCSDACEKHRLLWTQSDTSRMFSNENLEPASGRRTGGVRAEDQAQRAKDDAMHGTDTFLQNLQDPLREDRRRSRARSRWLVLGVLITGICAVAVCAYLS